MKEADLTARRGEREDNMDFRLIVRYYDTGVITEQYFPDTDTPDTIINYLDNALENGAKLNYILQQKTETGIDTIDSNSYDNTDCDKLPEWGKYQDMGY